MFSRESNADYLNPTLPIAQRVSDLLGRMTLEEKVGQMMQLDARTGELDELIVKRHVGSTGTAKTAPKTAKRRT